MYKKITRFISVIITSIMLLLLITPEYVINAKENSIGTEQYIETSHKLAFRPSYTGDASWLNDFELAEDPVIAGKVILKRYKGDSKFYYMPAESIYIPAKVTIDETEYDVTLNDNSLKYFFRADLGLAANTSTKSITFDPLIDTSNVTDMSGLFYDCQSLETINMSGLNTSNVTNMAGMFGNCRSLTNLNLSNFDTKNVTDMSGMFYYCDNITNLDLNSFNTKSVTNMPGMFAFCDNITNLDLNNFNTENVTNMSGMFFACGSLANLNTSSFNTKNVTVMDVMFDQCYSLVSLDLSNFNTENVTVMDGMFFYCSSLKNLNISSFNTSSVTDMSAMFEGCSSLASLDVSNFDTSNVTDMNFMFQGCSSLASLDVSNFDSSNVTSIGYMFYNCSSLTDLDLHNIDLSNLNDQYDYNSMLSRCASLQTINTPLNLNRDIALPGLYYRLDNPSETYTNLPKNQTTSRTLVKKNSVAIPTGISVSPTFKSIRIGDSFTITPTVLPDNVIDKIVNWSSSNPAIASVDTTGKVTGLANGTATITAVTNTGGLSATCTVIVSDSATSVTGITLTPTSRTMNVGDTFTITATVLPANATDKSVTWSSSNPTVASVNNIGKVTGLASGTTTITATTNDGGYKTTCTVTVTEDSSSIDVYRLYNPNSGEHFYTGDDSERRYLATIGWSDEGYAWTAPVLTDRPVYRLYNPNSGEHHYTTNEDEKNYLISLGWNDEDISWFSIRTQTSGTAIYRLYNPYVDDAGAHHYTTNLSERDYLVSVGWNYEGIGWYGL